MGKAKRKKGRERAEKEEALQGTANSNAGITVFVILFLSLSVFAAYFVSLNGTWALDDVVANRPVGLTDISDIFGYRKVAYLTFLWNHSISRFDPANYRIINILIHLINSILLFTLVRITLLRRGYGRKNKESIAGAAFLSAAFFALHPININAVSYIVQRMASLAAMFVLLGLLFYAVSSRTEGKVLHVVFTLFSLVSIMLGIFSKENAIMAIPLLALYDYFFISSFEIKRFIKNFRIIFIIALCGIIPAFFYLRLKDHIMDMAAILLHYDRPIPQKGWTAVDVYWTPLEHILTEFRVISEYISLILMPLPGRFVFDHWGYPLSKGLAEPMTTLFSLILILSLLFFAIIKAKKHPFLSFGILWYFIALSLESFIAVGSDLYFEHRNYLPMAGFTAGVITELWILLTEKYGEGDDDKAFPVKKSFTVIVIVSLLLGFATYKRNRVWENSVVLWEDTLNKGSENIRAMMSLGNAYLKENDFEKAERYFNMGVKKSYKEGRAVFFNEQAYSLGMIYLFSRNMEGVEKIINMLESTLLSSYKINMLKGFRSALENDFDSALMYYGEVTDKTEGIDRTIISVLTGNAYRRKGDINNAIQWYELGIKSDPSFPNSYIGMAQVMMGRKDHDSALRYLNTALSLAPDNPLALSDMADIMMLKKDFTNALKYASKALQKSPPFYQPYLVMGNLLTAQGKKEESEKFYDKARTFHVPEYLYLMARGRANLIGGNIESTRFYLEKLILLKDVPDNIKGMAKRFLEGS